MVVETAGSLAAGMCGIQETTADLSDVAQV